MDTNLTDSDDGLKALSDLVSADAVIFWRTPLCRDATRLRGDDQESQLCAEVLPWILSGGRGACALSSRPEALGRDCRRSDFAGRGWYRLLHEESGLRLPVVWYSVAPRHLALADAQPASEEGEGWAFVDVVKDSILALKSAIQSQMGWYVRSTWSLPLHLRAAVVGQHGIREAVLQTREAWSQISCVLDDLELGLREGGRAVAGKAHPLNANDDWDAIRQRSVYLARQMRSGARGGYLSWWIRSLLSTLCQRIPQLHALAEQPLAHPGDLEAIAVRHNQQRRYVNDVFELLLGG
jgi:hypothetical protein